MSRPSPTLFSRPLHALFWLTALACLLPVISSPMALVLGIVAASLGATPKGVNTGALAKKLLAFSIVGLGFGIQLDQAIEATRAGLGIIVVTIFGTLALGTLMARALKLDRKTGHLIASGTAICGGSAIAAVAPAIDADSKQVSLALGTVFVLNSVALFLFPVIGHWVGLTQEQFGIWSAIAIHDTSSVVGAAGAFGDQALITATTLKLARALWIIPVAFLSALAFRSQSRKLSVPMFILYYCVAIGVAHLLPQMAPVWEGVFWASKRLLVVCLFLIGCGITARRLREAGPRPLMLGVGLWLAISSVSLLYLIA
ncbi:YeiH family protein [Ferrimonas futtsuensis]|uniref:YeiH family protein n=1 Tax=Ferrimonas futtsuensis TaxID=364764 RepID=UPI00042865BA|nr:putative sulfate exporter family transporter [Ferrimonas futtsuensis]